MSSNPIPSDTQIQAHYKSKFSAGNYETARRYTAQYRRVHSQIADFVAAGPGDRLLDVGCFTGGLIGLLSERGVDCYGLELQPEAVEIANGVLPNRVYQADVHGSSFPPGPYDVVTMMGLIEHVQDPLAFLQRAYALLRPDGRLCLQTPDASSVVARVTGSMWPPLAAVEHIHLFSREAMRRALASCGFADIRIKAHVKTLPVGFVYEMLAHFGGRAIQAVFKPVRAVLRDTPLPFYVGEMLIEARRR
jgi:2-polyprenyl-3-methyl-5-hydroxy-6-metoxy-1,4-benzoquinol methylase